MSHEPVQLDYAPPPPSGARRARRWLLLVALLAGLWSAAEWGPGVVVRLRTRWVQSRCAGFEFPPDAVIFDSDPAAGAALLLAEPDNYVALDNRQVWPLTGVARREPACWTSLKQILFAGRASSFWPPGPAAPKAMVHRLRTARGDERLVAIIFAPNSRAGTGASPLGATPAEIGLVAALVRPGDWSTPPGWDGNSAFAPARFNTAKRLRIFAARLDPADPSRFSIPYEMDGRTGTIDGKLEDDTNLSLRVRDGPAKID